MTSFTHIETLLSNPDQIDLDQLRAALAAAREQWHKQEQQLLLYEHELQKEVRAKVELCGGIPSCCDPEMIDSLTGPALLAARREASHQFNQTFFIMPLSRTAQNPKQPEQPRYPAPKN